MQFKHKTLENHFQAESWVTGNGDAHKLYLNENISETRDLMPTISELLNSSIPWNKSAAVEICGNFIKSLSNIV